MHRENLGLAGQCQTLQSPESWTFLQASYLLTWGLKGTPISCQCTPPF